MRNRLSFVPLSCLMLFALAGCSASTSSPTPVASDDPFLQAEENITKLTAPCTFVASTGLMTVTVGAGETAIISRRAADSAILQNGYSCDNLATNSALKKIAITGNATANVILDFTNGLFGVGTSSTATSGITVTTAASVGIRGTTSADKVAYGSSGVNMNGDAFKDITFASVTAHTVYLGDGADTFTAAGGTDIGTAFTTAINVYGGAGADLFNQGTVATPNETIHGGADIDTVSYALRTAALTITVGAGVNDGDAAAGSGEKDDINADVEIVTGGTLADTMTASTAADITFNGGLGNDILTGNAGDDTLNGDGGTDTLKGGDGDDILSGGDGDDSFDEETLPNGKDIFNGGAGIDTLNYSARASGVTVTMDGTAANDGETVGSASEGDNCKADVENILGTTSDDTITGNALANTITGDAGNDTLNGGAGDDVFTTGAAADGDDKIAGGTGIDSIDYSTRTGPVTVVLDGVTGSGEGSEADLLALDMENVTGTPLGDTITGNKSANELTGLAGVDTLTGLEGDDVLDGGGQADILDCGAGDGDIGFNASGLKTACEF